MGFGEENVRANLQDQRPLPGCMQHAGKLRRLHQAICRNSPGSGICILSEDRQTPNAGNYQYKTKPRETLSHG
jgi:hypothetical protein